MHRIKIMIMFCLLTLIAGTISAQDDEDAVIVTYATTETVYLWDSANATPQQIFAGDSIFEVKTAPDGLRAAVLTDDGAAVWLAGVDMEPVLLVDALQVLGDALVLDAAWGDAQTLYFTTFTRDDSAFGVTLPDDLWRVDVTSQISQQIAEDGIGGAFAVSPDGRTVATAAAGTFTQDGLPDAEGVIRFHDTETGESRITLAYTAVATASPYPFYPRLTWTPDSAALLVAVPPSDLVYGDGGDTILWRVPVNGEPEQLGRVAAGFYGQPRPNAGGVGWLYVDDAGAIYRYDTSIGSRETVHEGAGLAVMPSPGSAYLWLSETGIFVGTPDNPTRYTLPDYPNRAMWGDETRFVYSSFDENGLTWTLASISGDSLATTVIDSDPLGLNAFHVRVVAAVP